MSMFPAVNIAGTGLEVDQTWIDAIGGNVANAQDAVTPGQPVYRDEEIVAGAAPASGSASAGNGVEVTGIALGSAQGILTYDPSDPIANKKGYVAYPDVNIGNEMTSLVEAQVSYEVNAKVLQNSTDAYNAILQIKS
ncbi:MAG: flagellar basal body rod C-terminal domain-containing protein [Acidimicrobiales bacterium]|jgi:flagellar basal-body rod protein FlgC